MRTKNVLSQNNIKSLSQEFDLPFLDVLLTACNFYGIRPFMDMSRLRIQLQSLHHKDIWQIILPGFSPNSPFSINHNEMALFLDKEKVAEIKSIRNDDIVLSYLRASGKSLTLNTNSRSNCTGCFFCPNIIEDSADLSVRKISGIHKVLEEACILYGWHDLTHLEVITVCSGCFHKPQYAIEHMENLRKAASQFGFHGRLHILTSVIRDETYLDFIADNLLPFHVTITLECFERRNELLKDSKASMSVDDMQAIMVACKERGIDVDFTYIVGLDPLEKTIEGLNHLAKYCTTFPRIQIFQPHNPYMQYYLDPDFEDIGSFIKVRKSVEEAFLDKGLKPQSWENYRPLWYSKIGNEIIDSDRI